MGKFNPEIGDYEAVGNWDKISELFPKGVDRHLRVFRPVVARECSRAPAPAGRRLNPPPTVPGEELVPGSGPQDGVGYRIYAPRRMGPHPV